MQVLVSVVAHEYESVLPSARIVVVHVGNHLVHHHLCLGFASHGEPSYSHIQFVGRHGVSSFTIIEQAKETVVDVALRFAERILTFEAKQIVVGAAFLPVSGVHAVVPCTVAKEQQVPRKVGITLGAVVLHFQVAPVSVGIGRAAREFVEQFVGG